MEAQRMNERVQALREQSWPRHACFRTCCEPGAFKKCVWHHSDREKKEQIEQT